jgi:hypothetical protein
MTFASGAVLCSIEGAVGADTESCCPNARIWSERALGVFQQYLRIPAEDLSRRQRRRRQARGRLHCGGQRFESPPLRHEFSGLRGSSLATSGKLKREEAGVARRFESRLYCEGVTPRSLRKWRLKLEIFS